MMDITYRIPDYSDDEIDLDAPEEIPEREQERLDAELFELIDLGAFDPDNEVLD